jgi:hypothetical protein
MSGNSGAWGIAMWKDGHEVPVQEQGISLSGGDAIDEYLPTEPLGCLTAPPQGLGVPPVRSGDVVFAQRDGVVQFADYYEPRILTFQVSICNDGCPGCPTGRARVKRLTKEWSRNCTGATLLIFSDCHNPAATGADLEALGPYLVHGRPRVAEVNWLPSDVGCADITLRFDAADARLLLAVDPAEPWTTQNCVDVPVNDPAVEVEILGDLCAYPVFTLSADLTDPITVTYGDFEFIYNEPVTGAADPVVVDTRWGIATQGGLEVTQNLSGDYNSPLAPGTHEVSATTGNVADDGSILMCWDNAVVSG